MANKRIVKTPEKRVVSVSDTKSKIYHKKYLVSWFAYNRRVIVDANSNPPFSNVKSL